MCGHTRVSVVFMYVVRVWCVHVCMSVCECMRAWCVCACMRVGYVYTFVLVLGSGIELSEVPADGSLPTACPSFVLLGSLPAHSQSETLLPSFPFSCGLSQGADVVLLAT